MDTILGILLGKSYSGIRALVDLSMYIKYTNKSPKLIVLHPHNSSIDFEQSTNFLEYHVLYHESVVPNAEQLKIAQQPDPNKVDKYINAYTMLCMVLNRY